MKFFTSWLGRKKASLCVLAGVCAISLCVILFSDGQNKGNGGGSYAVRIRHYGIDAREMERTVTIPLEDALSAISGVRTVQSSSENSLSRVFIRFDRSRRGQYEAVREAAQRVYETLPSSAQRPEIQSSDDSRIPVWSAAFFSSAGTADTAMVLERVVKPRLESLEGAGEVLVSGAGLREIIITLDQEKATAINIDPAGVAAALGMNDAVFSGGTLVCRDREIIVTVDGRYGQAADSSMMDASMADFMPEALNTGALGKALIPLDGGRAMRLSDIALITEQERMPDILSRLNGKKAAVISIMGSSSADLRKLSANIKKELAAFSLEFTVLSDRGAEEAIAFRSVFVAALQGAFMVAFISFLLNGKKSRNGLPAMNRAGIFCALAVPVICLVSAAILSILGLPPERPVLAGIAAGIGAAIDPVILCSEKLRKCATYHAAADALGQLRNPIIAGAATTVAALLPLSAMEGSGIIAQAIAVVTIASLVLSLSLLPPLLLWDSPAAKTRPVFARSELRIIRRLSRFVCRFLAADLKLCIHHPIRILIIGAVLSAAAVLALFLRGADPGSYGSEDSLYAQVEFDGGLLAEEVDHLLAVYGEKLAAQKGINNVETGARTGSGSLLISFAPTQLQAEKARELAKNIPIPGGFLFFPETSSRERYWEIKIAGDDDQKCRELAMELARLTAGLPLVNERVLNFKEGSKKLNLLPDREVMAEGGISFSHAANMARMGVYGPVAYKRIGSKGEIDVRVKTSGENNLRITTENSMGQSEHSPVSREGTLGILITGRQGRALRLDSLMYKKEGNEPASIRRESRRRSASITISTRPMDPRRVRKELAKLFNELELPPGYSIEFDPDAIRRAEALSGTVLSLLLVLTFCYMVIAAINESFSVPLVVLSAVPPSLAVPALCISLTGSPFNPAAACAFVAVSGMTINAAVLCAGALVPGGTYLDFYRVLRKKIPALLATTGTTIAGALPFLFLREGANTLVRTLSLVSALGVASSCFCAISVVPALLLLFRRIVEPKLPE